MDFYISILWRNDKFPVKRLTEFEWRKFNRYY